MTNLVMLYTGNVGSTPLIQVAARHPRIFVPVHEEFDGYKFIPFAGKARPCEELARTLDALFRRKSAPYIDTEAVRAWRSTDALPTKTEVPHVVFKLRMDGYEPDQSGARALAEVFREHAVRPVVLARRSIIEQAVKVWLSETQYGGRHQQFKASEMTAEDYAAYLREQDRVSIRADTASLREIRQIAAEFLARTRQSCRAARQHLEGSARPRLLLREQVLTPDLDYARVSHIFSNLLGETIDLPPDMAPKVRRGGLGTDHCANFAEIAADRALRRIEYRYQALLSKMPRLIPARPSVPFITRLRRALFARDVPFET